jgi:hypothetical protein
MNEERQRRLAFNEALVREVNEAVEGLAADWFEPEERIEFRCECADPACEQRVFLTRDDYLGVRADARWFVVAAGHEVPDLERVLHPIGEAHVVEKLGAGRAVAEETDSRS